MRWLIIGLVAAARATVAPEDDGFEEVETPPGLFAAPADQEGLTEAALAVVRHARASSASAEETELSLGALAPQFTSTIREGATETCVFDIQANLPPKAPMYSIMRALEEFFKPADRRFSAPANILVVSFNRFPPAGEKLRTHIYFPGVLDLSKVAGHGVGVYKLIGTIHNLGDTILQSYFVAETFVKDKGTIVARPGSQKEIPSETTVVSVIYERVS